MSDRSESYVSPRFLAEALRDGKDVDNLWTWTKTRRREARSIVRLEATIARRLDAIELPWMHYAWTARGSSLSLRDERATLLEYLRAYVPGPEGGWPEWTPLQAADRAWRAERTKVRNDGTGRPQPRPCDLGSAFFRDAMAAAKKRAAEKPAPPQIAPVKLSRNAIKLFALLEKCGPELMRLALLEKETVRK